MFFLVFRSNNFFSLYIYTFIFRFVKFVLRSVLKEFPTLRDQNNSFRQIVSLIRITQQSNTAQCPEVWILVGSALQGDHENIEAVRSRSVFVRWAIVRTVRSVELATRF